MAAFNYLDWHPTNFESGTRRVAESVVDQRWANLAIYTLIAFSLMLARYLEDIPMAVLAVLLHTGVTSIRHRYVTRVPNNRGLCFHLRPVHLPVPVANMNQKFEKEF